MNKEIESVIFSNVGNRLTQELAMGLVMNLAQILHQAVQAERQAAASAAAADAVDAGAGEQAGETVRSADQAAPAAIIDPAYQRKPSPTRRPRKSPAVPRAATPKPKKARQ